LTFEVTEVERKRTVVPIKSSRAEAEFSIVAWFRELLQRPVEPMGDYYERLQFTVAASAPVSKKPPIGRRSHRP